MGYKFTVLALLVAVSACQNNHASQSKAEEKSVVVNIVNKDGTPIDVSPSAGAPKAMIKASNPELKRDMQNGATKSGDLYYMPIGKDSSGCKYYTSFATGKVTLTAVYYKHGNGSFSNEREGAVCN